MQAAALACSKLEQCFGVGGDCTILARSESGEEHRFQVWSTLLRQWSEVFLAKLDRWSNSESTELVIDDASPAVVKAFLLFLYSGKLPSDASLPCVARLADKYMVTDLKLHCLSCMQRQLKRGKVNAQVLRHEIRRSSFTPAELHSGGVQLKQIRSLGFSMREFCHDGFSKHDLVIAGFTVEEFLEAFDMQELTR